MTNGTLWGDEDAAVLDRYLESLKNHPQRSEATALTYTAALNLYFRYLDGRRPERDNAQKWLDELSQQGKAANTLFTYKTAAVAFFAWRDGVTVRLIAPSVEWQRPEYLAVSDVERMLEAAAPLEAASIAGMFYGACRVSEILKLLVDDIDIEGKVLRVVGKGRREAEPVAVTKRCMDYFKVWLDHRADGASPLAFGPYISGSDWRMKANYLRRRLKQVATHLEIESLSGTPFHPHLFRHTRARQLIENKMPIERVSQQLRHRDINITIKIYGELLPSDQGRVLEQFTPGEQ